MDYIIVSLPVTLEINYVAEPLIPATWDHPAEGGYIEIHDINGVGFDLTDEQKDHIIEKYEEYFTDLIWEWEKNEI